MTARATATARAIAPDRPARPAPSLRPVPSARASRTAPGTLFSRLRARLSPVRIAAGIVIACLLAVVVGNMQLAAGQLRLSQLQAQVVALQSSEAAQQVTAAALVSPAAIAKDVKGKGLVQPSEILHIPPASLERRLPAPTFSYAPCCTLTPGR